MAFCTRSVFLSSPFLILFDLPLDIESVPESAPSSPAGTSPTVPLLPLAKSLCFDGGGPSGLKLGGEGLDIPEAGLGTTVAVS